MLPDTREVGFQVGVAFLHRMAAGNGRPTDLAQLLGPALRDTPATQAAFYHFVTGALQDYVRLKWSASAGPKTRTTVLGKTPELVERVFEFITDANGMVVGAIASKKVSQ